jgi:ubiquinone/menaquinone biosynthesis C-methylase UbiE
MTRDALPRRVSKEGALRDQYNLWHEGLSRDESLTDDALETWHHTVGRLLSIPDGASILEIGCGRGVFARWLSRRFPSSEIVAVDFSEMSISIAQKRSGPSYPQLHFQVCSGEALSFAENTFDLVVSCECLEHVPHPARMASEICRVLRPGGSLFLTTENYLNGMFLMWMKSWITGKPIDTGSGIQPHENFFLFWRVKRLLEKAGLRISHTESSHFQWLMLPRTDPAKLATLDFANPLLKRVFRPFGRHYTFVGYRPE